MYSYYARWNAYYKLRYMQGCGQIACLLLCLFCASCGGGSDTAGGSDSGGGLKVVTVTYDNGELASRGSVSADNQRQGVWDWYYDNKQPRLHAVFKDGVMQEGRDWSLYNKDGSTRALHDDGAYVFEKFWQ